MSTKLQVVAAMAVVGSVAGGGVALAHVPAVQQTAATASQPTDTSGQTLQSLLAQSAKLHAEIEGARQALAQANADAAASPQPSTGPDLSTAEPSEQQRDAPANSAPTAASTPPVNTPATPFAGDDGREAGDHEGGSEEHESHSTRESQPAPTRGSGGGDD